MRTIITDGQIVTKEEVLKGFDLVIEGHCIQSIIESGTGSTKDAVICCAKGGYVLPGIIDIHSDMIERYIQPRSTAIMDFEFGLREAERELAMCGITTIFHSISMYRDGTWDVKEIRKAPQVKRLAKLIKKYDTGSHMIRNRYHLRYEIDNMSCYEDVKQMIKEKEVDLLSFMDHTPGQGQYKNLDVFKKHQINEGKDLTKEQFDQLIQKELSKATVSFEQLKQLADDAKEQGIAVASHDDDTVDKLEANKILGVNISEFPITMDVAKEAVAKGFMTVLGAPNILLGGSHSGNLSALSAVEAGAASILVSDYYPQSLLQAVFLLKKQCGMDLANAMRLVSYNPAVAVGMDSMTGSIEAGKCADILVVSEDSGVPVLHTVFSDGVKIMECNYREKRKGEGA